MLLAASIAEVILKGVIVNVSFFLFIIGVFAFSVSYRNQCKKIEDERNKKYPKPKKIYNKY